MVWEIEFTGRRFDGIVRGPNLLSGIVKVRREPEEAVRVFELCKDLDRGLLRRITEYPFLSAPLLCLYSSRRCLFGPIDLANGILGVDQTELDRGSTVKCDVKQIRGAEEDGGILNVCSLGV